MARKSYRRRQSGGMLNAGYGVTTQGVYPGAPFYGVVDGSVGGCQAVAPPYALPASAAASFKGLPGMSGGGRRRLGARSSKKGSRLQRGGRYDGVPVAFAGPVVGNTPMATRIACEAGQGSPQPSPTVPTEPAVISTSAPVVSAGAGGMLGSIMNFFKGGKRRSRKMYRRNGSRKMRGGALLAPYSSGIPLEETTAGYSHFMPGQAGGVVAQTQSGVPFMVHEPSGGRLGESNACLTVGGTALPSSASFKMSGGRRRRSRKSRKSRKGRKH